MQRIDTFTVVSSGAATILEHSNDHSDCVISRDDVRRFESFVTPSDGSDRWWKSFSMWQSECNCKTIFEHDFFLSSSTMETKRQWNQSNHPFVDWLIQKSNGIEKCIRFHHLKSANCSNVDKKKTETIESTKWWQTKITVVRDDFVEY